MARGLWYPTRQADQLLWWANFGPKIALYGPGSALNLTAPQVTLAQGWATAFAAVIEFADSCKQSNQAVTQWKDDVLNGDPTKTIADPPVFAVGATPAGNEGTVKQLASRSS